MPYLHVQSLGRRFGSRCAGVRTLTSGFGVVDPFWEHWQTIQTFFYCQEYHKKQTMLGLIATLFGEFITNFLYNVYQLCKISLAAGDIICRYAFNSLQLSSGQYTANTVVNIHSKRSNFLPQISNPGMLGLWKCPAYPCAIDATYTGRIYWQ